MTYGLKTLANTPERFYEKYWAGSDSVPPDFKENPYQMYVYDRICGGRAKYRSYDKGPLVPLQLMNGFRHPPSFTEAEWDRLELTALSRAISRLRDHDLQLAVTVGEGRETVGMLAQTLRNIYGGLKAAKRGNLSEAARLLGGNQKGWPTKTRRPLDGDDLAGFYLGMRYGFVPALGESYNAMEAYRQKLHAQGQKFQGTGSAKSNLRYNASAISISKLKEPFNLPGQATRSVRIKLNLERELNLARYLGLTNPWSVAWELLPLSFVFDWALPVGQYLEAFNAVPAEGTTVVVSRRELIKSVGQPVSTNEIPAGWTGPKAVDGDQWMRYKYVNLKRTVSSWSAYNVPKPSLANGAGDIFGWKRVLDVVALGKVLLFGDSNPRALGKPPNSDSLIPRNRRGGASRKWGISPR